MYNISGDGSVKGGELPALKTCLKNPPIRFRWLLLGTMLCGIISGVGGMLSTYAFAQENEGYSGALYLGSPSCG